jgi:hypothetical protein
VRYFFYILILLVPLVSQAQLTAPGVSKVKFVSYPSDPDASDPVFVFCNPDGTIKGALTAAGPGGSGPFNFSWYKWTMLHEVSAFY